ncbi:MAG: IS1595 family transposase [Vicinamibacterales bacterium]
MTHPKTLSDASRYFASPDNCREYLVDRRWPNGVTCPVCGSTAVYFDHSRNGWECKTRHPKRKFTLKTGTIFEDSALRLDKWLPAVWMIANLKNGVSSHELARSIGVTQKTAWFMLQRIRLAMQDESGGKIGVHVEVDETFIGGKARNMHIAQRKRRITGRGTTDKTAVLGILKRGGKVRTTVVPDRKKAMLQDEINKHVRAGTSLYTDELLFYDGLEGKYAQRVIDHAVRYVDGQVHTNGMENYWSLLKRGLSGTYVSVEPFHLFRYLDEQAFRYNNRKDMNDADRFSAAICGIVGKRLTYAALTGKDDLQGNIVS